MINKSNYKITSIPSDLIFKTKSNLISKMNSKSLIKTNANNNTSRGLSSITNQSHQVYTQNNPLSSSTNKIIFGVSKKELHKN